MKIDHAISKCVFITTVFLLACNTSAQGYDCKSNIYNDISFLDPKKTVSPYDKIFVKIDCSQIPVGSYTIQVNWIKNNYGIIRTNRQDFVIDVPSDRMIYFWIKLHKKGMLSSGFSGNDYNEEFYGDWTVETYIDDEAVSSNTFLIQ